MANHSFLLCQNVVSLVKFSTAVGTDKRLRDAVKENMDIKEICFVPWKLANFTFHDGSPKAPEGFNLALIHYQKNWKEGTVWNWWQDFGF
jgi:hypothetical protein